MDIFLYNYTNSEYLLASFYLSLSKSITTTPLEYTLRRVENNYFIEIRKLCDVKRGYNNNENYDIGARFFNFISVYRPLLYIHYRTIERYVINIEYRLLI